VITDKEVGWYKSHVPLQKLNDICKFGVRTVQLGLRGFEFFVLFFIIFFSIQFYLLFVPTIAHTYIKILNYITKAPTCFGAFAPH